MTQQNAAMVEQSTAAARSLADDASGLAELVGQFRTGQDHHALAAPVQRPAPRRRAPSPSPMVHGNLALKAEPAAQDDDWTEF